MLGKAVVTDDGKALKISYEDYGVDSFGGRDYEVIYTLSKENRAKLLEALTSDGYTGHLSDMIITHFGLSLEKDSFSDYCGKHGIVFEQSVWID